MRSGAPGSSARSTPSSPACTNSTGADLEWILDALETSASFPGLKRNELQQFGEYRTQRYVLRGYDQLAQGQLPDLVP